MIKNTTKFCTALALLSALNIGFAPTAMASDNMQVQMLQREIAELRQQLAGEASTLNRCTRSTKNFRVAGTVVLGLTAVGIGVNIYQGVKRNQVRKEIVAADKEILALQQKLASLAPVGLEDLQDITPNNLSEEDKIVVRNTLETARAQLQILQSRPDCNSNQNCRELRDALQSAINQWQRLV